jgi:hypothetical protein
MLGPADGELKPDALVAGQQRKKPVGGGRGDGLEASGALQGPKGRDDVSIDVVEERAQSYQALAPEVHQGEQVPFPGGRE